MIETHTYADGTQRVGCPPFPALSPKEEQEAKLRGPVPKDADTPEPARRGRPPKTKDAD